MGRRFCPVLVNLFLCLAVYAGRRRRGPDGTERHFASEILHHVTMKFVDHRYIHDHVHHPGKLDVFDKIFFGCSIFIGLLFRLGH